MLKRLDRRPWAYERTDGSLRGVRGGDRVVNIAPYGMKRGVCVRGTSREGSNGGGNVSEGNGARPTMLLHDIVVSFDGRTAHGYTQLLLRVGRKIYRPRDAAKKPGMTDVGFRSINESHELL